MFPESMLREAFCMYDIGKLRDVSSPCVISSGRRDEECVVLNLVGGEGSVGEPIRPCKDMAHQRGCSIMCVVADERVFRHQNGVQRRVPNVHSCRFPFHTDSDVVSCVVCRAVDCLDRTLHKILRQDENENRVALAENKI